MKYVMAITAAFYIIWAFCPHIEISELYLRFLLLMIGLRVLGDAVRAFVKESEQ